jgi:hypothetical protein
MPTKSIQAAKAYIESLLKPWKDYWQNGRPPSTPQNELQDLSALEIIGLVLLVILLAIVIPATK